MVTQQKPEAIAAKGTGLVLLTLASAQFLMTLDSSVMNVSIATVAKDVGTTIADRPLEAAMSRHLALVTSKREATLKTRARADRVDASVD
jgi:hypothetical protein